MADSLEDLQGEVAKMAANPEYRYSPPIGQLARLIELILDERKLERERCLKDILEASCEMHADELAQSEAALHNGCSLNVITINAAVFFRHRVCMRIAARAAQQEAQKHG